MVTNPFIKTVYWPIKTNRLQQRWMFIPLIGLPVFVIIYIIATLCYPGGTDAHPLSQGFSWSENYWCNLLDERALNGAANTARPVALSGMLLLCVCFMVFWNYFPQAAPARKWIRSLVRLSGLAAMLCGAFLGTLAHNAVINLASLFGTVAVLGTLVLTYQLKWLQLFVFGILNIGLITANRLIYETDVFRAYLPLIQKLTFVSVLLWVWLLCFRSKQIKPVPVAAPRY